MTKREKRLKKLRANPRQVTFNELRTVLEDHGFWLDRVRGSHYLFLGDVCGVEEQIVIPYRRGTIDPGYVETALALIDLMEECSEEND